MDYHYVQKIGLQYDAEHQHMPKAKILLDNVFAILNRSGIVDIDTPRFPKGPLRDNVPWEELGHIFNERMSLESEFQYHTNIRFPFNPRRLPSSRRPGNATEVTLVNAAEHDFPQLQYFLSLHEMTWGSYKLRESSCSTITLMTIKTFLAKIDIDDKNLTWDEFEQEQADVPT